MSGFMVQDVQSSVAYIVGATATTDFAVPFAFDAADDLLVFIDGEAPGEGYLVEVVNTTEVDDFFTAATVRITPAITNATVVLARRTALQQFARFLASGAFSTATLNAEISRLWMAMQDWSRIATLGLKAPEGEGLDPMPARLVRANNLLGFNATGNPIAVPAAIGPALVSTFAATLLDDADAATARNTLGVSRQPSFRNLLINADFTINQRGYVSGAGTGAANQYTLDRWRVVVSGQAVTWVASGLDNIITAPAGGIEQLVEAANIEGGVYTLSWVGTATGRINGVTVANGGQATLPAATIATVRFSGGTVLRPQLEAGGIATAFERRFRAVELALCQRHYCTFYHNIWMPTAGTSSLTGQFPVTMYATPTMTSAVVNQVNASSYAVNAIDPLTFQVDATFSSTGYSARTITATAEL